MKRTDVTYGQLDRALRSLGFTCRPAKQDSPGRVYEHQTRATIMLPTMPAGEKVYEHHLAAARLELKNFRLADATLFAAKLQRAG